MVCTVWPPKCTGTPLLKSNEASLSLQFQGGKLVLIVKKTGKQMPVPEGYLCEGCDITTNYEQGSAETYPFVKILSGGKSNSS